MTKVAIYKNSIGEYRGFQVIGHSGYAEEGEDIVCSAVSVLSITILNALEQLTDQKMIQSADENIPEIKVSFKEDILPETKLLMDTFVLGLTGMVNEDYDQYFQLFFKEV